MGLSKGDICTEAGALIYLARIAKGLTQQNLADSLSINRASIANIESGRQNLTLVRLFEFAEGLGVSAQSLLTTEGVDHRGVAKRARAQQQVHVLEAQLARARLKAAEP